MSAARSRRAADRPVHRRPGTTPALGMPPAAPPIWRDPWAWASVLAVVPLVLHSLGAPLGVPCADDFGHLHHALFSPRQTWLDNGGSQTYWRPLAYQGYYALLTNVILTRPIVVAALHVALLALASLLFYRTARRFMPAPWAASAATFPVIAESTRALILVPIHFVDVGLIVFSALALHEAAAGRLRSALLGLLAALLCKESAVATGLLLPWIAPSGGRAAGGRRRWMGGTAAVVLAWAAVYAVVQTRTGLLPRAMESNLQEQGTHWLGRYGWAAAGSGRAIFSLPAAPGRWDETFVWGAVLLIAVVAAACFVRSAAARARLSRIAPLVAAGTLWTAVATMPLATVYPVWSPQRVAFNSIGFGVALSGTLGAAHPALLGALVALRLTRFGLSPGPPARVTMLPPETGAFVDFEQLIRLQRLMAATRGLLHAHFPRLPHGAAVVQHNLPLVTYYAFGGDRALQVWYRDSTLRWVTFDAFRRDPGRQVATVVEWQPTGAAEVALVAPEAMRALLRASDDIGRGAWDLALAELDRADSLQVDPGAGVFLGTVASKRSLGLVTIGRYAEAERAARKGLKAWPENPDSRYGLAQLCFANGRLDEAELQLDSLLALYPDDRGAVELREQVRAERARTPR